MEGDIAWPGPDTFPAGPPLELHWAWVEHVPGLSFFCVLAALFVVLWLWVLIVEDNKRADKSPWRDWRK